MVDPWKDCERVFDRHFLERMDERSLPFAHVDEALINGDKINTGARDYNVRWNKWTLKVSLGKCVLYLWTAYLDR